MGVAQIEKKIRRGKTSEHPVIKDMALSRCTDWYSSPGKSEDYRIEVEDQVWAGTKCDLKEAPASGARELVKLLAYSLQWS